MDRRWSEPLSLSEQERETLGFIQGESSGEDATEPSGRAESGLGTAMWGLVPRDDGGTGRQYSRGESKLRATQPAASQLGRATPRPEDHQGQVCPGVEKGGKQWRGD